MRKLYHAVSVAARSIVLPATLFAALSGISSQASAQECWAVSVRGGQFSCPGCLSPGAMPLQCTVHQCKDPAPAVDGWVLFQPGFSDFATANAARAGCAAGLTGAPSVTVAPPAPPPQCWAVSVRGGQFSGPPGTPMQCTVHQCQDPPPAVSGWQTLQAGLQDFAAANAVRLACVTMAAQTPPQPPVVIHRNPPRILPDPPPTRLHANPRQPRFHADPRQPRFHANPRRSSGLVNLPIPGSRDFTRTPASSGPEVDHIDGSESAAYAARHGVSPRSSPFALVKKIVRPRGVVRLLQYE